MRQPIDKNSGKIALQLKMSTDTFKRRGCDAVACGTAVARLDISDPTRSTFSLHTLSCSLTEPT